MSAPLKILVFGAGAIGTYVGGSLALAGHEVVFVERPQVAEQLRQRGLHLHLSGEEHHLPSPQISASLQQALETSAFNAGIFALKSYDTQAALESMRPQREALPPIFCLQNGVDNEPAIAAVLGMDKVIAGTVTSAVGRKAAGDIILEKLRGVGIAGQHPLVPELHRAMGAAHLNPRMYDRPEDMKWSKMLTNLVANASSAILDMQPAEIFAHPRLFDLEMMQLSEALRVMRAQGVRVVDLPATPVRLLAFAVRYVPPALSRKLLGRAVGGGRGEKMPSLHIDFHSGRDKSEVDYLNGAVVRYGERYDVPTPANRLLNQTLLSLVNGEVPPDSYKRQPEKLLSLLNDYL
jgi:2-dehydropantoate 2-reductase